MKITYKNVRKFYWCIMGLCLAIIILGSFLHASSAFLLITVSVMSILGIVLILKFWVCPYCGEPLPMREEHPCYCSHCGKELFK
ncbi:MAG: hypothetical protein SOY97_11660 [Candidatus Metalachnospira sp.]|nr:hypothetical protein [Candidatus Metalachnospira sp.]